MKTGLAGSSVENEDNIINIFTDDEPKKEESAVVAPAASQTEAVVQTSSKMDEVQKAYDMKEKGMLSEEEFNRLKAEILAR